MNVKIIEQSDTKIRFIVDEIDIGFANALRRIMFNEVPTMAIEFVDFEQNSSGFFDETIAHRLGMIPLTFDKKLYNLKNDCKCKGKGCSQCEVVLVLEKTGPCVVKAGDMKSTADDVQPADSDIIIVELLENQSLKFDGIAQLGFGNEHAKWQASVAGYQNVPIVRINTEKVSNAVIDACPTRVFSKKDGKVKVSDAMKCILCMKCVEISDGVNVSAEKNAFIFTVETTCGMNARDIVDRALETLETKANNFTDIFKKEVK